MNRPMGDDRRHGGGFGIDRTRSVFVGNISYEVTEEQLKDVFSKVGTVLHLRMVYDRESGKPKGYGFCEYAEAKFAELAIRNLNGYEMNGRALRVDSASGDQRHFGEGAEPAKEVPEESMYGPECEAGRAPEAISRSVASLPPEKMFHLMKQMKDVVLSNPTEAKNMLIQNPQLAYALLQAQVVMRIVDPQVAMTMLHREQPAAVASFHKTPPSSAGPPPPAFPPPASHNHNINRMGPPPYGAPPGGGWQGPSYGAAPPAASSPSFSGASHPGPPGGVFPRQEPLSGGDFSDADKSNAELLMQVLNLSEEEIALFPPEERQKVLALRNQLRNV